MDQTYHPQEEKAIAYWLNFTLSERTADQDSQINVVRVPL